MTVPDRSVAVVSRIYEPETGAAAFRLAAVVAALTEAGYRTTVITTQPPHRVASTRAVRRWPVLRDRSGAVRGYLQYASFDLPLLFRLCTLRKPDLVIVEPPPTTGVICRIVCRLRRVPYVYFSADVASTAARGIGLNRLVVTTLRAVEGWVLRGAGLVLAVSDGVRDEVVALGANPDRVSVVGTGVDTDVFSSTGPAPTGYEVGDPYFVYAGTMSEIQGVGVFIDAFARVIKTHPSAQLLMFGDGVELQEMQARARSLAPNNIRFLGRVSGTEIAAWLRDARAGLASVRPNRGYDFAYATKALASISCGTPVIYAGVGPGQALIADNGLGWATGWDPGQVADAMVEALAEDSNPVERNRLSNWVEQNHSLHLVGARVVTAIHRIESSRG